MPARPESPPPSAAPEAAEPEAAEPGAREAPDVGPSRGTSALRKVRDDVRLARVRDDRVRPPGPGAEGPSPAAAVWRFRAVVLVLVLLTVLLAVILVRLLTGFYGADPGVETGTPSAAAAPGWTGVSLRS